jgi:hypothetical protein
MVEFRDGSPTALSPDECLPSGLRALPPHPRRSLLRKYPNFDDMRAALAGALWEAGLQAEAEAEWQRVEDPRYRSRAWLRGERRWPPRLSSAVEALIDIRGVS